VNSASLAACGLAAGCRSSSDIYLPGGSDVTATPQTNAVSVGYFDNVGMSLLQGRYFTRSDTEKSPAVAIINQSLARKIFSNSDPIGRRFGFESKSANQFEVVGVVSDAQVNSVREPAPAMIFFPLDQAVVDVESLDVHTMGDPAAVAGQVRKVLSEIDPDLPVGKITTLREQVSSGLGQQRLIARLTTIFGGLALALACLGLYGIMSYTVARRTAELGIRLAIGARRAQILKLVLNQSLFLIGAGLLAGLALSFAGGRAIGSMLFGLSPYDPVVTLAAAVVLTTTAIASSLKPAWRAAHVDPAEALRVE
jgi:predicted permease